MRHVSAGPLTKHNFEVVSITSSSLGSRERGIWPRGKRFAFTIFDDPDAQTLHQSRTIYALLRDLGLVITKGVWMIEPRIRNSGGHTCEDTRYREHVLSLVEQGFEPGYHSGAPGSLCREEVLRSLDAFHSTFGFHPVTMANHYNDDAIYWGNARMTGLRKVAYKIGTRGSKRKFFGDSVGHRSFWGDLCRERVSYCRNFVTRNIDTLNDFPHLPYFDPARPFVRAWYGSSEGANYLSFIERVKEAAQDRLEENGGACIMYTHFGHGFFTGKGRLQPSFIKLMKRLAAKDGWFVPVGTLLDHLREKRGIHTLSARERSAMEWRWLANKLRYGTS